MKRRNWTDLHTIANTLLLQLTARDICRRKNDMAGVGLFALRAMECAMSAEIVARAAYGLQISQQMAALRTVMAAVDIARMQMTGASP